MKFGIVQQERFGAIGGSYSLVTARELYDSQVTATDEEALLLQAYFAERGITILRGNVASNPKAAGQNFRLYPSGETVTLNLVYPKPHKNELRLYLSERRGFMPNKGDVWFLFVSQKNELWIGAMPEQKWRERKEQTVLPNVSAHVPRQKIRSRELADRRLRLSKYKCEFDPQHNLFIARSTGCPYLEVHHVIPMMFARHYQKNLDALDNLCCLCPNCHRAVHHAEAPKVREILTRLAECRSTKFHYNVSHEELFRLYSAEEIVRT